MMLDSLSLSSHCADTIIIGVSVCVVGLVVVVVSVSLISWYQCCHKKRCRKNIENGSPGTGTLVTTVVGSWCPVYIGKFCYVGNRSKSSSTSTEDGHDGPPSGSPTLLISKTNGHVQQKKPGKSKKKSETAVQRLSGRI